MTTDFTHEVKKVKRSCLICGNMMILGEKSKRITDTENCRRKLWYECHTGRRNPKTYEPIKKESKKEVFNYVQTR